ncbi:MAG: DUF58 domain-containing protein [Planctomycetes bacterium]|nr:DUF58 domain-containing protein [Planctomycetota bacterium]
MAILLGLVLCGLALVALADESLFRPWLTAAILATAALVIDALLIPRGAVLGLVRKLPAEVGVGAPMTQTLNLSNLGTARLHGQLLDILPPSFEGERAPLSFALAPDEAMAWDASLSATDRGQFSLEHATAVVRGPLRLMRRVIRLSAPATVCAIPGIEVLHSNQLILKAAQDADAGISRSRGIGRGGEFESLAPYVPGDPPQSVDWKAFARTGQLAVRRYVPERRRNIMLACDAGRLMGARVGGRRKVDLALQALVKVAAAALHRGDLVGLMIFDGSIRAMVPPRGGGGQLARIVRASLGVSSAHTETAFTSAFVHMNHALSRRSLVVLATDFDNVASGWELQRNLAQIGRRHFALVAAMRDPVYHEILRRPVTGTPDAYRQLAALTLMEERQEILNRIHATGVYLVDAEPAELDVPLLNLYGRIVAGGKL